MSVSSTTARVLRGVARRLDPSGAGTTEAPSRLPDSYRTGPGTRVASYFFDEHPRFYDTGEAGLSSKPRLNLRHEAIFGENLDILQGARVLDIACHDGRMSMAALASGAASVVGVEARPELVDRARANLEHYDQDPARFRFIAGDVHEVLRTERLEVDVVLCLGFLYHTLRFNELLHGIHRTGARHLVLDTQAHGMFVPDPLVRLHSELSHRKGTAKSDDYTVGAAVLTGRPNLAAIRMMLGCYDYEIERFSDWPRILADNPDVKGCRDYAIGRRITLRCRRSAATE